MELKAGDAVRIMSDGKDEAAVLLGVSDDDNYIVVVRFPWFYLENRVSNDPLDREAVRAITRTGNDLVNGPR